MKPTRTKPPPKTPKKTPSKYKSTIKDPVKVYCRVKPIESVNELACLKILSPQIVQLTSPESAVNFRAGTYKEIQCTFQHVFGPDSTQKELFDDVALPLIEELIQGRNGLLFSYGVTGSGKTYTMTGDQKDAGILPRCFDVLFNSLADVQAPKYVFKPDRMNGFEVQNEADAAMDRQNEIIAQISSKTPKSSKKRSPTDMMGSNSSGSSTKVDGVDDDNTYAVFVTYVEIYNNSVYDLLEDFGDETARTRSLQTKMVREDARRNMYVHAAVEAEVTTAAEAYEAFASGQRRKRMAQTTLNAESSRSHSVFTLRLVQAPLDERGEGALLDRKALCVSQLSLVDLAGSERTNRTNNSGQRLREAAKINNSLMTLRNCLETLRENQLHGAGKMVPYRDSRVTHLFKGYFDGDGQIRMVVCANPRADDYDETVQVMKFAEMTQEVQVSRPVSARVAPPDLPAGRRKAAQIFKQAVQKLQDRDCDGAADADAEVDLGLVYSLGSFPAVLLPGADCDTVIAELVDFLEERSRKKAVLRADLAARMNQFRAHLLTTERDNILSRQEAASAGAALGQERKRTELLQSRLVEADEQAARLQRQCDSMEQELRLAKQELQEKDHELRCRAQDKERTKQKYTDKISEEKERLAREMRQRMREQKAELQTEMQGKDQKLRMVAQILSQDLPPPSTPAAATPGPPSTPRSAVSSHISRFEANLRAGGNATSSAQTPRTPRSRTKMGHNIAVSNPRYRRSQSAGAAVWIDHRSAMLAPLGTVLQPCMPNRISVTKMTAVSPHASKYCLTTQEVDTDGEVETRLYKADVLPTNGGGAQVVFNDVETLRQESPTTSPTRKRPSVSEPADTESRCAVSVEGHGKRSRR